MRFNVSFVKWRIYCLDINVLSCAGKCLNVQWFNGVILWEVEAESWVLGQPQWDQWQRDWWKQRIEVWKHLLYFKTQVDPMLAPWILLSGLCPDYLLLFLLQWFALLFIHIHSRLFISYFSQKNQKQFKHENLLRIYENIFQIMWVTVTCKKIHKLHQPFMKIYFPSYFQS